MAVDTRPFPDDGTPIGRVVAANLIPPAAALGDLQIAYMLVAPSCEAGTNVWLHVVHAAMLALAIAGGVLGWLSLRAVGQGQLHSDAGRVARTRFLAVVGMLSAGLLSLLIVAQWMSDFVLSPCQ